MWYPCVVVVLNCVLERTGSYWNVPVTVGSRVVLYGVEAELRQLTRQ